MRILTYMLKQMVIFMALFGCTHMVGQDMSYYTFIPDAEGNIDRDGFEIGYHSIYSQWDLNGDGNVSENEFYTVIFQRLDSNKNGSLSVKEWTPAQKCLSGQFLNKDSSSLQQGGRNALSIVNSEEKEVSFENLDKNSDNEISPGEFDAGLRDSGIFQHYDSNQNGTLDRNELNNGVYRSFDLNGNGLIEPEEYSGVKKLFIN